jgi:hypothetical protein
MARSYTLKDIALRDTYAHGLQKWIPVAWPTPYAKPNDTTYKIKCVVCGHTLRPKAARWRWSHERKHRKGIA